MESIVFLGVLVVICGILESYVLGSKWEHSKFLGLLHFGLCKTRLNSGLFFFWGGGGGGGGWFSQKTVVFGGSVLGFYRMVL